MASSKKTTKTTKTKKKTAKQGLTIAFRTLATPTSDWSNTKLSESELRERFKNDYLKNQAWSRQLHSWSVGQKPSKEASVVDGGKNDDDDGEQENEKGWMMVGFIRLTTYHRFTITSLDRQGYRCKFVTLKDKKWIPETWVGYIQKDVNHFSSSNDAVTVASATLRKQEYSVEPTPKTANTKRKRQLDDDDNDDDDLVVVEVKTKRRLEGSKNDDNGDLNEENVIDSNDKKVIENEYDDDDDDSNDNAVNEENVVETKEEKKLSAYLDVGDGLDDVLASLPEETITSPPTVNITAGDKVVASSLEITGPTTLVGHVVSAGTETVTVCVKIYDRITHPNTRQFKPVMNVVDNRNFKKPLDILIQKRLIKKQSTVALLNELDSSVTLPSRCSKTFSPLELPKQYRAVYWLGHVPPLSIKCSELECLGLYKVNMRSKCLCRGIFGESRDGWYIPDGHPSLKWTFPNLWSSVVKAITPKPTTTPINITHTQNLIQEVLTAHTVFYIQDFRVPEFPLSFQLFVPEFMLIIEVDKVVDVNLGKRRLSCELADILQHRIQIQTTVKNNFIVASSQFNYLRIVDNATYSQGEMTAMLLTLLHTIERDKSERKHQALNSTPINAARITRFIGVEYYSPSFVEQSIFYQMYEWCGLNGPQKSVSINDDMCQNSAATTTKTTKTTTTSKIRQPFISPISQLCFSATDEPSKLTRQTRTLHSPSSFKHDHKGPMEFVCDGIDKYARDEKFIIMYCTDNVKCDVSNVLAWHIFIPSCRVVIGFDTLSSHHERNRIKLAEFSKQPYIANRYHLLRIHPSYLQNQTPVRKNAMMQQVMHSFMNEVASSSGSIVKQL